MISSMLPKLLLGIEKLSEKWWGRLILIAIPVLVIFVPVYLSGKVFTQSDMTTYFYPAMDWFSHGLKTGSNILWNDQVLSGFAGFVFTGGFFSPINLLFFKLMPFLLATHVLLALDLILAGFFTSCFLKKLSVSNLASVFGALAYMMSMVMTMGADLPVFNSALILPLIFLILLSDFKKRRWWLVVLGGLLIGLASMWIHFNWLVIALSGGFLFVLGLKWIYNQTPLKYFVGQVARYIAMVVIGVAIGLFQFLPTIVYSQMSARFGGLSYANSIVESVLPLDFFGFILPNFALLSWSSYPFLYLGILPLIFLVFTLFTKNKRKVYFFSFLFILSIAIAVKYSPIFWAIQKLPVFHSLRAPSRWMFLGLFAGSVMASFGLDGFLASGCGRIKKEIISVFKWLVIVVGLVSVMATAILAIWGDTINIKIKEYFDANMFAGTTGLPLEHYHQVIDGMFNQLSQIISWGNYKFVFSFLILLLSYLVIRFFTIHESKAKYFLSVVVLVMGLNFILIFPFDSPVLSMIDRDVFAYQSRTAELVNKNPGRVLSFMSGFAQYEKLAVPHSPDSEDVFEFVAESLAPQLNIFYGVSSIDGYTGIMPERYGEILALLGSDRAVAKVRLSGMDLPLIKKVELFQARHNLLDMMGVRYVISAYDLRDQNLRYLTTVFATQYQIPIYVFENQNALQLVYWAKETSYLAPGAEDNHKTIINPQNDFHQITFIECSDCPEVIGTEDGVDILEKQNGYLKVRAALPDNAWLIFSEQSLPGWTVKIDDQPAEMHLANNLFMAVLVPAGEHEIVFEFTYLDIIRHILER